MRNTVSPQQYLQLQQPGIGVTLNHPLSPQACSFPKAWALTLLWTRCWGDPTCKPVSQLRWLGARPTASTLFLPRQTDKP